MEWPFGYGYCHCGCGEKTTVSHRERPDAGWTKGDPLRFVVGHNTRIRKTLAIEERFWAKAQRGADDVCWPWQAAKNPSGYGYFSVRGKCRIASRISWEITHGPITDSLCVLHKCDNPACVNPAHLFLGTREDNVADMISKGRRDLHGTRMVLRGEESGASKLTNDDVLSLRRQRQKGTTIRELAEKYGISHTHAKRIIYRKSWAHI